MRKDDDRWHGDNTQQTHDRGQGNRERDIAACKSGQQVGRCAARRGGEDHDPQRKFYRQWPQCHQQQRDHRQQDDLGEHTNE